MTDKTLKTVHAAGVAKSAVEATEDEMALVNAQSIRELSPDEVYLFRARACDTLPDRDDERFTEDTLKDLAPKFVGRPMLCDHRWDSGSITARIYAASVEPAPEAEGESCLMVRAYVPRSEETEPLVNAIETGMLREVSVGVSVAEHKCSICGARIKRSFFTGPKCENGHEQGRTYDGEVCYGLLDGGGDAYELSFVAVPAQPAAGATKGFDRDAALTLAEALKALDEKRRAEEPGKTPAKGAEPAKEPPKDTRTPEEHRNVMRQLSKLFMDADFGEND